MSQSNHDPLHRLKMQSSSSIPDVRDHANAVLEAFAKNETYAVAQFRAGMERAAELCEEEAESARALLNENPHIGNMAKDRIAGTRDAMRSMARTIRAFRDAGPNPENEIVHSYPEPVDSSGGPIGADVAARQSRHAVGIKQPWDDGTARAEVIRVLDRYFHDSPSAGLVLGFAANDILKALREFSQVRRFEAGDGYLCKNCGKHWGAHRTSDERCPAQDSITTKENDRG